MKPASFPAIVLLYTLFRLVLLIAVFMIFDFLRLGVIPALFFAVIVSAGLSFLCGEKLRAQIVESFLFSQEERKKKIKAREAKKTPEAEDLIVERQKNS